MNGGNEILGFAVLTGPLWLVLLLVVLAICIAVVIGKRFARSATRIAAGLVVGLFVLLLPFVDHIGGRMYFSRLCATDAGTKVYQTVLLPAEYWDEAGQPRFIKGAGALDTSVLRGYGTDAKIEDAESIFSIKRFRFMYLDTKREKVIGEVINFQYRGGWIARNFSPSRSGMSCDIPELSDSRRTVLSIFKKAA
jgi:hypothetical protein